MGTSLTITAVPLEQISKNFSNEKQLLSIFKIENGISQSGEFLTDEDKSAIREIFLKLFEKENILFIDDMFDIDNKWSSKYNRGLFTEYYFSDSFNDQLLFGYIIPESIIQKIPTKIYSLHLKIQSEQQRFYLIASKKFRNIRYSRLKKKFEQWFDMRISKHDEESYDTFFNFLTYVWNNGLDMIYLVE